MEKDQIIIIGGGLIGLATANALLDRGEKVLVLERNTETASAASFANAGMLTPSQSTPWNSPSDIANIFSGIGKKGSPMSVSFGTIPSYFFWGLRFMFNSTSSKFERISRDIFSLAKYSKDLTEKIRNLEKFTYDESTDGTLKLFRDSDRLQKSISLSNRIYGESNAIQVLNQKEVIDLEPTLKKVRKGLVGGIHYKDDEIEKNLIKLGAVFEKHSEDKMLEITANELAKEKTVGWFQGRMEFGPRALGSRSIIGDPRSSTTVSYTHLTLPTILLV